MDAVRRNKRIKNPPKFSERQVAERLDVPAARGDFTPLMATQYLDNYIGKQQYVVICSGGEQSNRIGYLVVKCLVLRLFLKILP